MRSKVIGIGKCGSRLTYDFFAYVSGTPAAYEIRTRGNDNTLFRLTSKYKIAEGLVRGYNELQFKLKAFVQEIFGDLLIFDSPLLVTIDSDTQNNEIINWIQFLNKEEKSIIFPGVSFNFANHTGGCDFHIISENICNDWDINDRVINDEGADIIVSSFSIGGGTGGGAAPIILYKSKKRLIKNNKSAQVHFMGIGVLPISDQEYKDHDILGDMSTSEKYNTGRFFSKLYGKAYYNKKANTSKQEDSTREQASENLDKEVNNSKPENSESLNDNISYIDSIWLFSNDLLRYIPNNKKEDESFDDPNISIVNRYIAASLTVICNASSPLTKSEPNFDSIEMNNRLNGLPFISGYALRENDKSVDKKSYLLSVKELFSLALNNASISKSELCGLSVPVRFNEINTLNEILTGESEKSDDSKFKELLSNLEIDQTPLEFRTAEKVIMLYGQSIDNHSAYKDETAKFMASSIFKNSDFYDYYYKHPGSSDILLILIINPFLRFVQNSIYYYTDVSWLKDKKENIDDLFDDLITNDKFEEQKIDNILNDKEILSKEFLGEATIKLVNSYPNPLKMEKHNIINTFNHLHKIFHFKKLPVKRKSKI